ncbi:hypothetical protein ACQEVF_56470 [Nonomuraea polychroma]|uniref:hypothetical protein n=1 Tax=Nonomuraea polychroma TaxID=46176 RepID=UPI003D8CEFC5
MALTERRYTLSQFARRVGISEGRARAMWAEKDRLPKPDGHDADGRPLWHASTIDRWCRRTGRTVPENATGLTSWPDAHEPAPIVFRGEVQLPHSSWMPPGRVYVIVWDTPHGHLVHVTRYSKEWMDPGNAARAAAHVLQPTFWQDAVIVVPPPGSFGESNYDYYDIDAYRLVPGGTPDPDSRYGRRFLFSQNTSVDDDDPFDPDSVPVEPAALYYTSDIARVIGQPVPMWLEGTCTTTAVQRLEVFGAAATFTIPDTTTNWPSTRDKLETARSWGMAERYPQAFAQLAGDTLATLAKVQEDHAAQRERGDGWYLVARPAHPDWPIALEQAARQAADLPLDLEAAADELPRLRIDEAEATYPGIVGEALDDAVHTLGTLLRRHKPEIVFDTTVRKVITGSGPVVEQWKQTLTRVPEHDRAELTSTRRFARLLAADISPAAEEEFRSVAEAQQHVTDVWHDQSGRLVVQFDESMGGRETWLATEWPTGQPEAWGDTTVIAGDPASDGAVFALTPLADGTLRADPLPNPGDKPGYTWGYTGSGPTTLYSALARCVLGTWSNRNDWIVRSWTTGIRAHSELWHLITHTKQGASIRMPWPQVQAWIHEDHKRATAGSA